MPKISICIPVYGVEKYIEQCARSLFEQTMTEDIEFIFVDDCTQDRSIDILQQILADYPQRKSQTKIIHHEKNGGLVAARNTALKYVSGDYVIHCDSDDWADLDLYETMYKQAVESDADVVCAPFIAEYSDGLRDSQKIGAKISEDVRGYIKKNYVQHLNSLWTKLYRREIALDPSLNCPDHICMGEDLLRNIQMLDKCKNIAFVSGTYYHYRQNSASMTQNFGSRYFFNLKKIIDFLKESYLDKYPRVYLHLKMTALLAALRNIGRDDELLQLFNEEWKTLSFKEKIKIVFLGKCSLKARAALAAVCVSKQMIIFLLKLKSRHK